MNPQKINILGSDFLGNNSISKSCVGIIFDGKKLKIFDMSENGIYLKIDFIPADPCYFKYDSKNEYYLNNSIYKMPDNDTKKKDNQDVKIKVKYCVKYIYPTTYETLLTEKLDSTVNLSKIYEIEAGKTYYLSLNKNLYFQAVLPENMNSSKSYKDNIICTKECLCKDDYISKIHFK